MTEPKWLSLRTVTSIQQRLIEDFGGATGLRDDGLLESALARAVNLYAYGSPSLFELAAAYAFGIARNHPFVDGNKRAAFMTAYIFLRMNGHRITAPEAEAVVVMRDLAAGELGEAELAAWIRINATALAD